MTWTIPLVAGILATGLGIGFLSGLLGVGGGFLMAPVLAYVFGFEWKIAVGSGLAQMVGMSAAGFRAHMRRGNVEWKLACFMIIFTVAGGAVGHAVIQHLDTFSVSLPKGEIRAIDFWIPIIYAVMLTVLSVVTMREAASVLRSKAHGDVEPGGRLAGIRIPPYLTLTKLERKELSIPVVAVAAFVSGIMLGLLGIGGGVVMQPLMIYVLGIPTRIAIGSSLVMVFGSALAIVGEKAWDGHVDPVLVALLLCSSPIGVQIGARLCNRISSQRIRFLFAVAVLCALVLVISSFIARVL